MDPEVELIEQLPSDAVDFMKSENERKPERFYYTIVAPSSFRANSIYSMNFTIHDPKCDFNEPVVLRVSIEDEDTDENDPAQPNISKDVEMKPNHTEVISLPIGNISSDRNYKLVVKGISGVIIDREASLDLQTQTHSILIQSDKAIYKPNDCVKFRIFVLDSELKAAKTNDDELSISFTDPYRNLVKKWTNVKTMNGVFSSELQLSDSPNLGEWKIMAEINEQVKIAVIEVAEYVLPKFEATIEGYDHFTLDDEKVVVTVGAKYTHGKPLRGKALITINEEDNFGYFRFRRESVASQEESMLIKKIVDIDGLETIEFNIKDELKYDRSECNLFCDVKNFKIDVEVTENLTGLTQSASKTIKVHKNTYDVSSDLGHAGLKRDSSVDVTISVRKQDGSCVSFIDPSKKKITIIREQFHTNVDESTKTETVHDLDDDGNLFLTLDIAKNESSFSIKTNYCGQETDLGLFYTTACSVMDKIALNAKVVTERCRTYKEVEIELMSHYPFPTITYQIVARGKILESNTIITAFDLNDTEYIHRFKFVPTFDHAPRAQVIIYYVKDEHIVSTNVGVDLYDDFKNFVELEAVPRICEPGQSVDLTVRSNPNSFIGLLGVDKSVMLLRGGNDLAHDEIWNELEMFHSQIKRRIYEYGQSRKRSMPVYHNEWSDFKRAGLITFSNTIEPIRVETCYRLMACDMMVRSSCFSEPEGSIVLPKTRKEFPETWIWETFDSKTSDGILTLKKKVPDSITSWILTGFSIHPEHGLAITKSPTNLCVEQPFYISLNLPYSVKRGEIVSIPVSIFNYLQNDVDADVKLENENGEFEFVDSAVNDQIYPEIMKQAYRQKKAFVRSDDAVNVNFMIRPIKIGSISLKITATSTVAGDCVLKPLLVECEGVTKYINKAMFIDLREKSAIDEIDVKIDIPKDALPDSMRIDVNCLGDLLGGTIKNLEHLIRLPHGCGEQNMLNFVPNIVILNYLKNTQQLVPVIEEKAKRFMEIGYQRELTYKHKDGSFSAFGQSDKCGSTWLTAFVARSFRQAADYIVIQEHIIDECLKWLSEAQAEDGSFAEKGSVCHKEMQSGAANGVALTAYVLTAFLMNKDSKNTYAQVIDKAIENILKSVQTLDDVYAVAVVSYALELANHSSKKELIDRLISMSKKNENYQWWEKAIGKDMFGKSKTLNVEITAYALLTLLSTKKVSDCLPILKWLLNQRNDQGGFEGTQDTIVGLEALANFASKITSKDTKIKMELDSDSTVADGKKKVYFEVNADNALILQSQKIPPEAQSLKVNATGKGFALLELAYRYNTKETEPKSAFTLTTNADLPNENLLKLEIKTQYQPQDVKDSTKRSNMAVLEISMPSGFVIGTEALDKLKTKFPTIKRIETKNSETVGIIYFDHIGTEAITLNVDGYREHEIDEQKPASVHVYDYYDNSSQAREFYSIGKSPEKMEVTKL